MILTYSATQIFLRFNRYMVECELQKLAATTATLYRFNRYMVECELFTKK